MTERETESARAREQRGASEKIPDVRSAAFRAEARRQSRAVAESPGATEDQAFIDSISVWPNE